MDYALGPHEGDVAVSQRAQDESHQGIQFVFVRFVILLQDGDEKALDGEGLTQGGCQIDAITVKQLQLFGIVTVIFAADGPSKKEQVSDDADDTVGHESGSEIVELYDEN